MSAIVLDDSAQNITYFLAESEIQRPRTKARAVTLDGIIREYSDNKIERCEMIIVTPATKTITMLADIRMTT
jgi:cytochrome c-type biogenesis protein CcmE